MQKQIPFKRAREVAYCKTYGRTLEQLRAVPEGIDGAYCVTLADDMLTATCQPKRIDTAISGRDYKNHGFFEGSSIRKIGSTYYFIYSSANNHELCYATSQYPDRDFVYGGTIVSNGDVFYQGRKPKDRLNHTGTNHGSIECVNGQWYVFYHRQTRHSDYSRQACAEKITVLPDGGIPQVEVTSCGLNGGPLAGKGTYPANICCNLTNGKMRHGGNQNKKYDAPMVTGDDTDRFVGSIGDRTLIGYKYFALEGTEKLTIRIRGDFRGAAEIRTAPDGTPAATISLEPTESWQSFTAQLAVPKGIYPIYFRFSGKGKADLIDFTLE